MRYVLSVLYALCAIDWLFNFVAYCVDSSKADPLLVGCALFISFCFFGVMTIDSLFKGR